MQNLTTWFEDSLLPFLGLFAVHQFVENFYTFLQLTLLLISTASSTLHLQALVATPQGNKLQKSRDVLILISLNIWALSLLGLPDAHVWRAVFFIVPQQPLSVGSLLACVLRLLFQRRQVLNANSRGCPMPTQSSGLPNEYGAGILWQVV